MHNEPATITILITDDIAQNRAYFCQKIKKISLNAQIWEAENGEVAVKLTSEKIAQSGSSFDMIIMDFKMPKLNGQQATTAIRQLERAANLTKPSMIITWSSAMSAPYVEADDWLPKMFSLDEVERVLSSFFAGKV